LKAVRKLMGGGIKWEEVGAEKERLIFGK